MGNILYTFKEVCEKTGYRASAIRYYEREFKIIIPRDVNGRRIFTQKEFELICSIKELQEQGYSNSQIKKLLDENMDKLKEACVSAEGSPLNKIGLSQNSLILETLNKKLEEINSNLSELSININGKERDQIISENLKLKMQIKQKAYEIIELKEKLRYERERGKGFFAKFLKK